MQLEFKKNYLVIDVIVIVLGISCVLSSVSDINLITKNLLEALGTGLIAAGFVSFLIRMLYTDKAGNKVEIEDDDRINIDSKYNKLRAESRLLDIDRDCSI